MTEDKTPNNEADGYTPPGWESEVKKQHDASPAKAREVKPSRPTVKPEQPERDKEDGLLSRLKANWPLLRNVAIAAWMVIVVWQLFAIQSSTKDLQNDVSRIDSDVSSIESDVNSIDGDLTGIKSDVGSIQTDVDSVKDAVSSIQIAVDSVKDDVSSIQIEGVQIKR